MTNDSKLHHFFAEPVDAGVDEAEKWLVNYSATLSTETTKKYWELTCSSRIKDLRKKNKKTKAKSKLTIQEIDEYFEKFTALALTELGPQLVSN